MSLSLPLHDISLGSTSRHTRWSLPTRTLGPSSSWRAKSPGGYLRTLSWVRIAIWCILYLPTFFTALHYFFTFGLFFPSPLMLFHMHFLSTPCLYVERIISTRASTGTVVSRFECWQTGTYKFQTSVLNKPCLTMWLQMRLPCCIEWDK